MLDSFVVVGDTVAAFIGVPSVLFSLELASEGEDGVASFPGWFSSSAVVLTAAISLSSTTGV